MREPGGALLAAARIESFSDAARDSFGGFGSADAACAARRAAAMKLDALPGSGAAGAISRNASSEAATRSGCVTLPPTLRCDWSNSRVTMGSTKVNAPSQAP